MKKTVIALAVLAAVIVGVSTTPAAAAPKAKTVYLDELDVRLSSSGWQSTRKNRSVGGARLKIAGKSYKRGVGTHAHGIFRVKLDAVWSQNSAVLEYRPEFTMKPPRELPTGRFVVASDRTLLRCQGLAITVHSEREHIS